MNNFLTCCFFSIAFGTMCSTSVLGQKNIQYPNSFNQKIEKMGVEFYYPIEHRIKRKKMDHDDFLKYDLVLKSKGKFEIRYFLYPYDDPSKGQIHPHVEMTRTIADIATNDEYENIRITSISPSEVNKRFGADWGIYADFVPKDSFSSFRIGRMVSLYREGRGHLNCIILYKKDNLDAFMGLPVRFAGNEKIYN